MAPLGKLALVKLHGFDVLTLEVVVRYLPFLPPHHSLSKWFPRIPHTLMGCGRKLRREREEFG
jgi:hypothetical protein